MEWGCEWISSYVWYWMVVFMIVSCHIRYDTSCHIWYDVSYLATRLDFLQDPHKGRDKEIVQLHTNKKLVYTSRKQHIDVWRRWASWEMTLHGEGEGLNNGPVPGQLLHL